MSSFSALFLLPSVSFIERVDTADSRKAFFCSWSERRKSNLFDTFLLSYRYVTGFKLVLEHTSLSINCLSSTLLQKLKVLNLITDLASTRHFCSEFGDSWLHKGFTLWTIRFIAQKIYFPPSGKYLCVLYGFQNKQRLFPCTGLNFVTETECVYCVVRIVCLYKTETFEGLFIY